jgi:hypothetical protein
LSVLLKTLLGSISSTRAIYYPISEDVVLAQIAHDYTEQNAAKVHVCPHKLGCSI